MRFFFFSNDVELTSITNDKQSEKTGKLVAEKGIPKLLDLYDKYDVKTTFFVTGDFARLFPDSVRLIHDRGHDIGSHGMVHGHNEAYDKLNYEQQLSSLKESKRVLEDIIAQPVISFRAPALRVNKFTAQALIDSGFLIDSSIASQRFDFFLSFGTLSKLKWLLAPRSPYYCNPDNLAKKGKSQLFEIPLISLIYPYIGTTLRISPVATSFIRQLLLWESMIFNRVVVFLVHPNELIQEDIESVTTRRSSNQIQYFFAERTRRFLKRKNLGLVALDLLEKEIKICKNYNYHMISMESYYKLLKVKKNG